MGMVSIAASTASAAEGSPLAYTLTRTGDTSSALTVNLAVADTTTNGATPGFDFYAPLQATFAAGASTATASILTFADTLAEPTEHFTLSVQPDAAYTVAAGAGSATFDILDKTPSVVSIAASTASATEGSPLAYTLTRSGDVSGALTVNLVVAATATDGATPGSDFSAPLQATFAAGASTATASILTFSDTLTEPTEHFTLTIPTNASYVVASGAGSATFDILNKTPSVVSIAASTASATEGSPLAYTLTRSGDVSGALTVNLVVAATATDGATPGSDFSAPLQATFAAGSSTATASILTFADSVTEPTEHFTLTIPTNASYVVASGAGSATFDILNKTPSVVSIAASTASAAEGSSLAYTLTRTGDVSGALTVNLAVAATATDGATPGSDFYAPLQATFAAGSSSVTTSITTFTDSVTEPTEHFTLTIPTNASYVVAAGAGSATFDLLDKAPPTVSITPLSAVKAEGSSGPTPFTFTVSLSEAVNTGLSIPVTITGTGANPTNAADFAPGTATSVFMAAGQTSTVFTVYAAVDTAVEPDETFAVQLGSGSGYKVSTSAGSASGTILNDDTGGLPALQFGMGTGSYTLTEGSSGTVEVAFYRTGDLSAPLTAHYTIDSASSGTNLPTAVAGSDFNDLTGGALTFAAGQDKAVASFSAIDDALSEGRESFYVRLSPQSGYTIGPSIGTSVTIIDNEPEAVGNTVSIAATPASASEGSPLGYTLTRTGDITAALSVNLFVASTAVDGATPGSDFSAPLQAVFAAGSATTTSAITTFTDALVEPTEHFLLSIQTSSAYSIAAGAGTATFDILDKALPAVSIAASTASAQEGSPLAYTLTRTGDTSGALTVNLAVAATATNGATPGSDFFAPLQATFAAGSATATASITTYADALVEPTEHFTLTVQPNAAYTVAAGAGTATFDILDKPVPTVSISAATATAFEGSTLAYTLTRAGDVSSALTVNLSVLGSGDHPATPGQDFFAPLQATFAAGATTVTRTITTTDDGVAEGAETFTLSVVSGSTYAVGTRDAAFTIKDHATMQTWTNGDWSTAASWSSGTVPGSNDDVTVVGAGWPIVHTVTAAVSAGNLASPGSDVTIGSSGALTLSGGATFGGASGASGTLKFVNGGELTTAGGVTVAKTGHILSDNDHVNQPNAVIHGDVVNNGDIRVDYGSGLRIDGKLTGTGDTLVYGDASLEIDGAAAARVAFVGSSGGTIILRDAAASTGDITYYGSGALDFNDDATGFGGKLYVQSVGTKVDLVDVVSASLAGSNVHVTTKAGQSFDIATSFALGGSDAFELVTSADGHGGTVVGFQSRIEHAPDAFPVAFSVNEGASPSGVPTGPYALQGQDIDGDPLTLLTIKALGGQDPATAIATNGATTRVEGAYGTLLVGYDGQLAYEQTKAITGVSGQHPTDRFEYTLTDGRSGPVSATVTVSIDREATPTDDAVVVTGRTLTVGAANGVLKNDVDPDGDALRVTSVASPDFMGSGDGLNTEIWGRYGNLTLNADGSYAYHVRAMPGVDGVVTLHDTFVYTVDEANASTTGPSGVLSGQPTATLDIAFQANRSSVLTNDVAYLDPAKGSFFSTDAAHGVLANDSDPDGDALYITGVNGQPAPASFVTGTYGTLSLNPDGSWSYNLQNAPTDPNAVDTFTIDVSDVAPWDSNGLTSSRSESLEIRFGAPPSQSGHVVDGYIAGATVFADANGNGKLDIGEASTTTAADGGFTLTGGSGPIVSFGGTDTATGLAFAGKLTAPAGSSVITPLTTLVSALAAAGVADPTAKAVAVFGLPTGTDLSSYDPIAKAAAGDAAGQAAFVAGLKLVNTATLIASTVAGSNASAFDAAFTSAIAQIAVKIADPISPISAADLGQSSIVASLVTATATAQNVTLGSGLAAGAGQTAANLNGALDGVTGTGSAALANASAIALVAQGSASEALKSATPTTIAQVTSSYSGSALSTAIETASHGTGDVDGPGTNSAPTTAGDHYVTTRDHALTVSAAQGVLANDSDPDGGAITAALAAQAQHGTVLLAPDGAFTYTPNAGYSGADSFTYTASDGSLVSAPTRVDIEVPAGSLVLRVSEDAYQGHAQYLVRVDGVQVGDVQTAGASHAASATQEVTFHGSFAGAHSVAVEFLNDAYGGVGQDRNLYVEQVTINGQTHLGSEAAFSTYGVVSGTEAGLFSAGSASFDLTKLSGPSTGTGPDSLVLRVSEDAYQGHAQYLVRVDGVQVGDVQTAGASHAASATQEVTFHGSFAGAHSVAVEFLNDAYGGVGQDRNLYVEQVTINGQTHLGSEAAFSTYGVVSGTEAGLFSAGSASFDLTKLSGPSTGTGPDSLVLRVSEDAYQGHAQYLVRVDGVQVGDVQTAGASHAASATQEVTFHGSFAGAHSVAVEFLNDAYGGVGQDRNLYVEQVTINGQTHLGSEAAFSTYGVVSGTEAGLFSAGSATFQLDPAVAIRPNSGATVVSTSADEHFFSAGGDTFAFHPGFGHDTITNFSPAANDLIQFDRALAADFASLNITQTGADTSIVFDAHSALVLKDMSAASISSNDFLFV